MHHLLTRESTFFSQGVHWDENSLIWHGLRSPVLRWGWQVNDCSNPDLRISAATWIPGACPKYFCFDDPVCLGCV